MPIGDPQESHPLAHPQIAVNRITVVRVAGTVDDQALSALQGILHDLVHNHGVADLAIDLTGADTVLVDLSDLLSRAQEGVAGNGGILEIRFADSDDISSAAPLPDEVPAFVAVDPDEQGRT